MNGSNLTASTVTFTKQQNSGNDFDLIEIDCPQFSEAWRLDHPDFPMDPRLGSGTRGLGVAA